MHFLSELYLLYAKLEEEHGLARHAMAVYERATTAVLPEEQYEVHIYEDNDFPCTVEYFSHATILIWRVKNQPTEFVNIKTHHHILQ